jgi:asparagine synthase (glutamine-hydrolysing)
MCGICGKLMFDREAEVSPRVLKKMADAIQHRGPDDEGFYSSGPIGLGFRRLSIIDLSLGHQPLSNEDGTVWIVFNGEIYNFQELREELLEKGHVFRTRTDTEVIVHLYEELGERCVERLRGMFGFAIWDERNQQLLLARDRVGIKPLYYSLTSRFLSFGSEIKAIIADPEVPREIEPAVIDRFLTFYYVPGEETLFKNIYKLAPGCCLVVRDGKARVRQYWDLQFQRGVPVPSLREAEEQLVDLLDQTVQMHMISDVPVGFLLSGGVDSTALLSFAVAKTDRPISSFTVGFSASGVVDERPYARLVARKFGTQHHEITISPQDFIGFLSPYVWHMEEPVCEPPAIALYYVSKLARGHVKVLISGEGGDEAFAGYSNYRNLSWLERIKSLMGPLCGPASASLVTLNHVLRSEKIAKYAPLLDISFDEYYYTRTSSPRTFFNSRMHEVYSPDFAAQVGKARSDSVVIPYRNNGRKHSILDKMLYLDTKTWLPDDLLIKADRMTMANSIELRVPYLDHKVLEFAASLPANYKLRGWTRKYIAKKALGKRLPREILARKKMGFPVPYESWLRKDVKSWVSEVLLDRETIDRGYFQRRAIENLLAADSLSNTYSKEIFSLLILELWHRTFLESGTVCPA